jgi:hypothetical protein
MFSAVAWACVAAAADARDMSSVAMSCVGLRDAVRAARRERGEWRVRSTHLDLVDAASAARLVVWQPSRAWHSGAAADSGAVAGLGPGLRAWPVLWDLGLVTTRVEPGFWDRVFDACPRLRRVTVDAEYADGMDALVRLGAPRLHALRVRQTSPCAHVPDQPLGIVVSETLVEYDNAVLAIAVHAPRLRTLKIRDHAGARVLDACVVPALDALDWTCPWDRLLGWAPPPSARHVRLTVTALYSMTSVRDAVCAIAGIRGLETLDVTLDMGSIFDRFSRVTWPCLGACLGATRPCLGATRPCLGATRPCLGATRPCLGATRPCLVTVRATFPPLGFVDCVPRAWDLRFDEPITAETSRALDDLYREGACSDDEDVVFFKAQLLQFM